MTAAAIVSIITAAAAAVVAIITALRGENVRRQMQEHVRAFHVKPAASPRRPSQE